MSPSSPPARNWGGTYAYRAARLHRPRSVAELQELVAGLPALRPLGTTHSFQGVADLPGGDLVSVADLDLPIELDAEARTVTVPAGASYGMLARHLEERGWAVANLASLPHISVAGAVATGTHGSGDRVGSLAAEAVGLELVTASGELLRATRATHPDEFDGMVVALGALGVVTRVTLRVEPSFAVAQTVWDRLPFAELEERYDEITASGYSTSLFLDWSGDAVGQVWIKERVAADAPPASRPPRGGAVLADGPRHPVPGMPTEAITEQGGVPGPWLERLAHFRMGHTPSAGEELQSEYLVPRAAALDAMRAVRALAGRITPLLFTSEVRTVAADGLWLSPAYGADVVGIHFTWRPDPAGVRAVLPGIEAALAPFAPRPHWGKLFLAEAAELAPRYPRHADFVALAERLDPDRKLRSPFLDAHLFGAGGDG